MLEIVCEWPALEIPLTRSALDAQLILDAAARAQVIFSDEHLPERPSEGDGPSPRPVRHGSGPAVAGDGSRARP
jgi:hypothetical protein